MPLRLIRPPATTPDGWLADFRALLAEQYLRLGLRRPVAGYTRVARRIFAAVTRGAGKFEPGEIS